MVYRPNEAKVKNLKAKDYLGKAKLIAAADRNNMLTGYGDAKRTTTPVIDQRALEDRSPEQISYGASNLVQKNLSIRTRQHSEPPLNRNVFPPTPPPDTDKSSTSSAGGSLGGRSASVRAARPPRLDLERPGANVAGQGPSAEKPRIGTTRAASESRGQQPRGLYIQTTGLNQGQGQAQGQAQGQVQGQGHRRGVSDTGYTDGFDGFSAYPPVRRSLVMSSGSRRMVNPRSQPQQYIDEQDEYGSDDENGDTGPGRFHDGEFEIVGSGASPSSTRRKHTRQQVAINKFRIKVHAAHDTRYIIVAPNVQLGEFESKIRGKFGFATALKIKMRDDGDMVTMVDQEDLDLLLLAAKEVAQREGSELGKMEVWVEERGAPMI